MNLWRDFVDGFTDGFLSAAARQIQALPHRNGDGRIDRLCNELNWPVDERDGGTTRLHFTSKTGGLRKVCIMDGDQAIVTFITHSEAVVPAAKLPPDLSAYLLCRNLNGSGIGNWAMHVDDEDDVTFALIYQPLGDGLNATSFKFICESLVGETVDFDGKMREAGLLR